MGRCPIYIGLQQNKLTQEKQVSEERYLPPEINNMLHDLASVSFGVLIGSILYSNLSLSVKVVAMVCALIALADRARSK